MLSLMKVMSLGATVQEIGTADLHPFELLQGG